MQITGQLKHSWFSASVFIGLLAVALAGVASGANLTWDATNALAGAQEGNGIWSSASNNWWDGAQNVAWTNSPGDMAVFGDTAANAGYTVTLGENVIVGGLAFRRPYTINSGGGTNITISGIISNVNWGAATFATLNLGLSLASDLTIVLQSNVNDDAGVTLNGSIGETGGSRKITILGNGKSYLTMAGANTFSGGLDYSNAMRFYVNSDQALGSGAFTHRGGSFYSQTGPRTFTNSIILRTPSGSLNHDFQSGGGTNTLLGRITLEGDARFSVNVPLRVAGAITNGAGAGSVTVIGGLVMFEATNSYTGATILEDVTLRAVDGVGLPASSLLWLEGLSGNTPNTLETTGTFNRTLGSFAGQIRWGTVDGGFSAFGGPLTVDLNTLNTRDALTWGQSMFISIGRNLVLNSRWADSPIEWYDNLDLSATAGDRTFLVPDNANASNDYAKITGIVSSGGSTNANLVKFYSTRPNDPSAGTLELAPYTGSNTYRGLTVIQDGAIRAMDGTGVPAASRIQFNSANGGAFEGSGGATFNRTLGNSGSNAIEWAGGSGGFAAYGGALTVDLNNLGTRDTLTWGSTPFFVTNGQKLVFGSRTADSRVDWYDNLDLGSSGTNNRVIEVRDNPFSTGDFVRITGDIAGSASQTLLKTNTGLLELPDLKTFSGAVAAGGGALRYTNLPAANPLVLTGGVYEANGAFTRDLGTSGPNVVAWAPGAAGGFSAVSGPLSVYVGNGASDPLTWGAANFLGFSGVSGYPLILSSVFADNVVTFSNNLYGSGNVNATIQVDDNPASTNDRVVLAGVLNFQGTRQFYKTGAGTLEMVNTNTFNCPLVVNNGMVLLNAASGNAVTPTGISIGDGIGASFSAGVRLARVNQIADSVTVTLAGPEGWFDMNGFDETIGGISFATNNTVDTGTNLLTLSSEYPLGASLVGATGTVSGRVRLSSVIAKGLYSGTVVVNAQVDAVSGFTLRGQVNSATFILTNPNNAFLGQVGVSDAGNLILRGSNVISGATLVEVGSTANAFSKSVMIDGPHTVTRPIQRTGAGSGSAVHTLGGMNTGAGRAVYTNTVSLSGNWPISLSALYAGDVVEFQGAIKDSATTTTNDIVKAGLGTVILSATNNSYKGATTVSSGTLLVNGALTSGGSTVTVYSAATLGGTGIISRAVVIATNGAIAPGTTNAGILTVAGNLSFQEGALFTCYGGKVQINGTLTLPTNATVNVVNQSNWTLFSATTLAGAANLSGWKIVGQRSSRVTIAGNDVVLKQSVGTLFVVH